MQTRWFDDREIVRQLPLSYRMYAAYCRGMVNRRTQNIRGGSFLLRRLTAVRRGLRMRRELQVRVGGASLFVDLYDPRLRILLDEARRGGPEADLLLAVLRPGDSFLDVGANHGTYSVMASSLVQPGGRVISVEPQPHLAELLRRSLAANGADPSSVWEVALSDRAGTTEFFVPASSSGSGSVYQGYVTDSAMHRFTVRVERLDDHIPWRELPGRILLKLDVEGSELPFLRGASEMIRERRPVLLFEANPSSASAAGYSIPALLSYLAELGYSHVARVEEFPATRPIGEVTIDEMENLVALQGSLEAHQP